MPLSVRKPIRPSQLGLVFAAALSIPVVSACMANEPVATQPGTTPAVWTGSPSPAAPGGHGAEHGDGAEAAGHAAGGETLTAQIKAPDGSSVATAEFVFVEGYATVTVKTTAAGRLTPGFHGLHIHSVGKCEANSVAPTGGAPGDFNSAGGHFQVGGHSGLASGYLPPLQVREDGTGELVTTTDAFTAEELQDGAKTAIIIHEKADNFANIPPERYQQIVGAAPGPDEATLATGDAGKRVACGVIGAG